MVLPPRTSCRSDLVNRCEGLTNDIERFIIIYIFV